MSDTPSVNTARVVIPEIEPQPDPTYADYVGADQTQYYKIPASGKSDSYVTFNNLTTLGKDRAYLDNFEVEITVEVTVNTLASGGWAPPPHGFFMPVSFPFNSVCEQARININGGAFFNSPMSTLRAKERYWDDERLQESFANHTPCCKAYLQDEMTSANSGSVGTVFSGTLSAYRTRMFGQHVGYGSRPNGPLASTNFSILPNYTVTPTDPTTGAQSTFTVTWREPIFCSPFSSRYDATWARPLYNITSIDMAFNLVDLRNMFLLIDQTIADYQVHIKEVMLCYTVLTVTAPISHSFTVVPYRRYVPYITDVQGPNPDGTVPGDRITSISATSGVYTLNEVPTAIWVFLAPSLSEYQRFIWNGTPNIDHVFGQNNNSRHTNNKLFGFMKHISISCGNTTQILNTASIYDLYRIAKRNGCKDNFEDWTRADPFDLQSHPYNLNAEGGTVSIATPPPCVPGCGSVLRLIPGVDIVLPEQKLIPGSNANNLVFQVQADFDFNGLGDRPRNVALWLLFEYVGVASITPGNCVVTMNPLGNGAIMAAAPTVSGTAALPSEVEQSTTEGSGDLEGGMNWLSVLNGIKNTGLVGNALSFVPKVGPVLGTLAKSMGWGYKRPRGGAAIGTAMDDPSLADNAALNGGAVMGLGDFC